MTAPDPAYKVANLIRPVTATIEGCAIDGGYEPGEWQTRDLAERIADELADAGLLADPADRDVKARLIAHRNVLRRMDRAEAEVARLNDELIHVREVAELAEKDRRTYHRDALRAEAEVADLVAEGIRQKRRANDAIAERDELRGRLSELIDAHQKQRRFADQNYENWQRAEAQVTRLNAALDAQEPAAEKLFARVDAAEAKLRSARRDAAADWAGYFRTADSAVGWPTLTISRVIELLESGHEPFGCSAALDGSGQQ